MMKKIIVIIILIVFILAPLSTIITGCEYSPSGDARYDSIGQLLPCETDNTLFYDKNTKIVYYIMRHFTGNQGYGYMSPYISENGNFCKYVDGEIVEVQK